MKRASRAVQRKVRVDMELLYKLLSLFILPPRALLPEIRHALRTCGASGPERKTLFFRLSLRAARTLKCRGSTRGPIYRRGKSTFESSLWATAGGEGA